MTYIEDLIKLELFDGFIEWFREHDTPQEAWDSCEAGDDMAWLLDLVSGLPESEARKNLALAICRCARLSLVCISSGDKRPLEMLTMVEQWCRGEEAICREGVLEMASSMYDAAHGNPDEAEGNVNCVARSAAYVAAFQVDDPLFDYFPPTYEAIQGISDAVAASSGSKRAGKDSIRQCASIIREFFPIVPSLQATSENRK